MTAPRVVHLLATAREEGAGIARLVRTVAQTLDRDRYRCGVWFLNGEGPLADELRGEGIEVRTLPWKADRRDLAGAHHFWRALCLDSPSIVHLHVGGRAVPFLVRMAGSARIVRHLHDSGAEAGLGGPMAVRPWMADRVVALSRSVAARVAGVQPQVVYHGVRLPEPDAAREPSADRSVVLGVASRLVPVKGIGCLLRALATLHRELPNVRLEIAGAGPEEEALRHQARALGVGDRVTFLGWQISVAPLFGRWDVFVQPSLDEGFGMAALDAMAAGLPVVGTSVGGLPELIDDGRTGYLVPPSDAAALAGRLRELLMSPERRRAMGSAGRACVRERFSAERMVEEIGDIYDRLLATKRSFTSLLPRSG